MTKRKRLLHSDINLDELTTVGDVVLLYTKPLTVEDLGVAGHDFDLEINLSDVRARLAGTVRGRVVSVWHAGLEISTRDDPNHEDGCMIDFDASSDLTAIQVLEEKSESPRIVAGDITLYFHDGRIFVDLDDDDVDFEVEPALVSAIARVRNWTYDNDDSDDDDREQAWDHRILITPEGFQCGCQSCTLEELDELLDWCADRFWGK